MAQPVRRHEADNAKRLRQLESENARLKKLLAKNELDQAMLKGAGVGRSSDQVGLASTA